MKFVCGCSAVLLCLQVVFGDIYFHSPRGSNNRLDERSAERTNANRAFNSQNNNRGGYNVGDRLLGEKTNEEAKQYQMEYFQSSPQLDNSKLYLEWTNQHGCGGDQDESPHKLNCNIVIQFMCQPEADDGTVAPPDIYRLRDGTSTSTPSFTKNYKSNPYDETQSDANNRRQSSVRAEKVYMESWESYDDCYLRQRNKGLFTADQHLNGDRAKYTRQSPNGDQYGYECPEERDYYPYWHPNAWKDIAVLANDETHCNWYKQESFNSVGKGRCQHVYPGSDVCRHWSKYNNEAECVANGGDWVVLYNYLEIMEDLTQAQCLALSEPDRYMWEFPYRRDNRCAEKKCLVKLPEVDCRAADRTRVNHLGNTVTGQPMSYTWLLPNFPSGNRQRCFLRARYNISTDDYHPNETDSTSNKYNGQMSPIQQNPAVDIGAANQPLQLAINTAQFGRTFQDRTHLFKLVPRSAGAADHVIHNIGVRGKRGNIVQVYPAVEYDFFPNHLTVNADDLVHIQWTGSNSHDNDSPGGDGQTGDAGEGQDGTDRHNVVEIKDLSYNYPVAYEASTMFKDATVVWPEAPTGTTVNPMDVAISYASAGYYLCATGCGANSVDTKAALNNLLNNAYPSYLGMLLRFSPGTYYYMCSRNNNFTNRSQKATLVVNPPSS